MIKGKQIATKEIGFYEYNHKLDEELENEIKKNKNGAEQSVAVNVGQEPTTSI